MLRVVPLDDPRDLKPFLEGLAHPQLRLIIADSWEKKLFQWLISEENEKLPSLEILPAHQLWQQKLEPHRPSLKMISQSLALSLATDILTTSRWDWAKTQGAASVALNYLNQLLPILSHPEGESVLRLWFDQNPRSYAQWGHWFEESLRLWNFFNHENRILPQWTKACLLNDLGVPQESNELLIFFLGVQLTSIERELILHFSRYQEIVLLKPSPREFYGNPALFSEYDILEKSTSGGPQIPKEIRGNESSKCQFLKFTTALAEVKQATAQIKLWRDQGARLSEIAVVAVDPNPYRPALEAYLKFENIAIQKKRALGMRTLPSVMQWLARLRVKADRFSFSDLESSLFSARSGASYNFSDFKATFSTLLDATDLARPFALPDWMSDTKINTEESLSLAQFIEYGSCLWPGEYSRHHLESIVELLSGEDFPTMRLPLSEWVSYLESRLVNAPITIEETVEEAGEETVEGVSFWPLIATEIMQADYLIFLGATEQFMRRNNGFLISKSESSYLRNQTGFDLEQRDDALLEGLVRALLARPRNATLVSFPATDFAGNPLTPSLFWLENRASDATMNLPLKTGWDEVGRLAPEVIIDSVPLQKSLNSALFLERMREDLGLQEDKNINYKPNWSLSVSYLQKYLECPFVFLSEKGFRLLDLPEVDVDPSPVTKGRLMHVLFQRILEKFETAKIDSDFLQKTIDQIFNEFKLPDLGFRDMLRKQFLKMGSDFLALESQWRANFPLTKTPFTELAFEGFISLESGALQKNPPAQGYPFRGIIDRLDTDGENRWVLIDYKLSGSRLKQLESWIDQGLIQLPLYAQAVERGLAPIKSPTVVGAFYYVIKDRNRDRGFKVIDQGDTLFDFSDRKRNKITSSEKDQLLKQVSDLVAQTLVRIAHGEFFRKPREEKQCRQCHWSRLCRKPM